MDLNIEIKNLIDKSNSEFKSTTDYHRIIGIICLLSQLCEKIIIFLVSAINSEREGYLIDDYIIDYSKWPLRKLVTELSNIKTTLGISNKDYEFIKNIPSIRRTWAHHAYEKFENNKTSREYFDYIFFRKNKAISDMNRLYRTYKLLLKILKKDMKLNPNRYSNDIWRNSND